MIHRLFASPTLYSAMAMFFDFPFQELHARLIARTIGRDHKSVLRQLRLLRECGMIDCRTVGCRKWYRLSDRHPLYEEFDTKGSTTCSRKAWCRTASGNTRCYPFPGPGGDAFPGEAADRARATTIDVTA